MCLSVPAEVIEVKGEMARVNLGGIEYEASIMLVDDVRPGDYVLLHTGFAIQKLDREEALKTLELFRDLEEFNKLEGLTGNSDEIH